MSKIVRYIKEHRFIRILLFVAALLAGACTGYYIGHLQSRKKKRTAYVQIHRIAPPPKAIPPTADYGRPVDSGEAGERVKPEPPAVAAKPESRGETDISRGVAAGRRRSGLSGCLQYIREHRFIRILLFLMILSAALFAGYRIHHVHRLREQQAAYERMAQAVQRNRVLPLPEETSEPASEQTPVHPEPEQTAEPEEEIDLIAAFLQIEGFQEKYGQYLTNGVPDFKVLRETNGDIVAYLCLPDSVIEYPVLQNEKDDYYLNHNLDGSRGYPGCLYIENVNSPDFNDPVTIIYGHRLLSGGMFSDLDDFLDSAYMDSHLFYFLYLPDEIQIYEIMFASKYSNRHLLSGRFSQLEENLYEFDGFNGDEGRLIYDEIKAAGLEGNFRAERIPAETDRMIYWSTCLPARDKKMVVGARRITAENIAEIVD